MQSSLGNKAVYHAPSKAFELDCRDIVAAVRPVSLTDAELELMVQTSLYCAGSTSLLELSPIVSVVGTRGITDAGAARARRLAKELAERKAVLMSGLARGVDATAMTATIGAGGKMIGVVATPLDRATPKSSAPIQETCWRNHLLVSPFPAGTKTQKSHFPARNKVMALLSDATVIVEAGETSGTVHQASECKRLGRKLFFLRSLVDQNLRWVRSFLDDYDDAFVLESTDELMELLE